MASPVPMQDFPAYTYDFILLPWFHVPQATWFPYFSMPCPCFLLIFFPFPAIFPLPKGNVFVFLSMSSNTLSCWRISASSSTSVYQRGYEKDTYCLYTADNVSS